MTSPKKRWLYLGFLFIAIYGFALFFGLINEQFDRSEPQIVQGVVVKKFVRHNPLPISVLEVHGDGASIYNVDVLDEISARSDIGSEISLIKKSGFLGKPWVQEKNFFQSLEHTNSIVGIFNLILFTVPVAIWLRTAWKTNQLVVGGGGLGLSLICAFFVFRFVL